MWLKGSKQGIIYVQKNSQIFKINRDSFEVRNSISTKGKYECAISITKEDDSINPLYYVNSYYYKFLTFKIDDNLDFEKKIDSFLSVEPSISVVNLWRREIGSFLRFFNPTDNERIIILSGNLVNDQIRELDLKYNELSTSKSENVNVKPWEIKTLKL
jgi:hypothetical protein